MSKEKNPRTTYHASVAQKNQILGIGMNLRDITDDDYPDYTDDDLEDIIAQIDVLTKRLKMFPHDRENVLYGIVIDHQGHYSYEGESLSRNLGSVTVAYQRLTNLALKH